MTVLSVYYKSIIKLVSQYYNLVYSVVTCYSILLKTFASVRLCTSYEHAYVFGILQTKLFGTPIIEMIEWPGFIVLHYI